MTSCGRETSVYLEYQGPEGYILPGYGMRKQFIDSRSQDPLKAKGSKKIMASLKSHKIQQPK